VPNIKAAIYARVSTSDQNCDMQLSELREYASRMGWDPPAEYVEKASGKRGTKRPVQERLIADARLRRFDVVMVWKIDRMGRSFLELAGIIETLDQLGIRFVIPSQGIDTDKRSPMSRFVIGIFSLIAEFERAIIVERVSAGVEQSRKDYAAGRIGKDKHTRSGKDLPSGRPKKIFRRDEALRLRSEGVSFRAIAKTLKVPVSTVVDALKAGGKTG